ncbi:MAG: hypothetical protein ACOC9O_02365 [Myxococcota bacterium]
MIRKGLGAALVVAWGGWLEPAVVQAQAQAPEEEESSCVPACRSGYVCRQGECVSACNPPCADGERCTGWAECEPARGAAEAPGSSHGPPSQQPAQAPRGQQPEQQWRGAPRGKASQGRQPRSQRRWQPRSQQRQQPRGRVPPAGQRPRQQGQPPASEEPDDDDPGRGFRAAFTLPLVAIGGRAQNPSMFTDYTRDFGTPLDPSMGWGALIEGNFPYFGLGGGLRNIYWRTQGMDQRFRAIDVYFSPRLRIPFGAGEAFLAAPFGFSVDIPPGGLGEDWGLGYNLAVRAGSQFYLGDHVGLFFAVGGLFRRSWPLAATKQVLFEVGLAIL